MKVETGVMLLEAQEPANPQTHGTDSLSAFRRSQAR